MTSQPTILPIRFNAPFFISSAVLLASAILPLPENGKIANLPSPCGLWTLTSLPCPACGLTRSFVCCGHLQLAEAFQWHPLGPFLFAATGVFILATLFKIQFQFQKWQIASLASVAFAVWILRLGGIWPLPS